MNSIDEKADPRTTFYQECENEPIHLSGMAQSYGALVTTDITDGIILQVSSNTLQILGYQPEKLIGSNISSLIGEKLAQELLATDLIPSEPCLYKPYEVSSKDQQSCPYNILMNVHQNDQVLIFEFELSEKDLRESFSYFLESINHIVHSGKILCEEELIQNTVNYLQRFTQFDRVMYYAFDADGTGIVKNEARANNDITSYLEHRFPASDIPIQARILYKNNLLRYIDDTETTPASLIPDRNPVTDKPLDLSFSYLRSVANVHIQYLRNMNVQTSMSLPIVMDDELVALIACHGEKVKHLPPYKRVICQSIPVVLNSHLSKIQRRSKIKCNEEVRGLLGPFIQKIIIGNDFLKTIKEYINNILILLDSHCFYLKLGESRLVHPETFEPLELPDQLLHLVNESGIYISDHIIDELKLSREQKNLLVGAILIGLDDGDFLCIGRSEHIETITWGGNPDSPDVKLKPGKMLTPRASFESWVEKVRGHSKPFSDYDRAAVHELRTILIRAKALEYRRVSEERLREEATTDPLTGILNRREFMRQGNIEVNKALRYQRPLSLLYLDIDHFKHINDKYGHDAGDEVLKNFTSVISGRLRQHDIFARMGGEEFSVLLPETRVFEAEKLADELRKLIETSEINIEDKLIRVTSSFGISSIQHEHDDTLDQMVNRADKALYRAKESGRNCVKIVND